MNNINWKKLSKFITVELIVLYTAYVHFYKQGGMDLHVYYLPFVSGDLGAGFVPYFSKWFMFPLSLIPKHFVWTLWTFITLISLTLISKLTKVNSALLLFSFPIIGQIYLGQIDIFIILGICLILFYDNHYVRSFGITLALIKPQITIIAIIYIFIEANWKSRMKLMIIPALTLLISFFQFGILWPIDWITNILENLPIHPWRINSGYFWLIGLFLVFIPSMVKNVRTKVLLSLLIATLASPYFSIYSFTIFLVFKTNWKTTLLSFLWILLIPLFGSRALIFSYILPIWMIIDIIKENWAEINESRIGNFFNQNIISQKISG